MAGTSGHEKTVFPPHFPPKERAVSWEGYIFPTCWFLCSSQVNKLKYSLGSDDSQKRKTAILPSRDRAWSQEIRKLCFQLHWGKGWAAGFEGPSSPQVRGWLGMAQALEWAPVT